MGWQERKVEPGQASLLSACILGQELEFDQGNHEGHCRVLGWEWGDLISGGGRVGCRG